MTREQFIRFIEGTQEALRRFLVALCCGDAALADDIAQDTCLKAYLACDSLSDPDKFQSWLFRIGYNTFVTSVKSRRTYSDYSEARDLPADDTGDSPFRYQALYSALDRLSDCERSSILLFYMQGYSVKEIANIEQTSLDAVRQHLSRGRIHLRGLLSNA